MFQTCSTLPSECQKQKQSVENVTDTVDRYNDISRCGDLCVLLLKHVTQFHSFLNVNKILICSLYSAASL
jgi:hypothetical protein